MLSYETIQQTKDAEKKENVRRGRLSMVVQRVERQLIKKADPFYEMLDEFCFNAKNLYNHANYIVRQNFINERKWIRYSDLDKQLKQDTAYSDYRNMPTAQSAQQLLRSLDRDWKSFFVAIKDWKKNKDKYLSRPKLPKYKKKDGRCLLTLTNQDVKLKDGRLCFPKVFKGFTRTVICVNKSKFVSFQQVRFVPKYNHIEMEVVYNVNIPDSKLTDNGRYLSIDIGVDNLTTVTNNFGSKPFIVNGKGLKSVNKFYNKQMSHYRKIVKQMNNKDYSKRMYYLTVKRNRKIEDYLHKASRYIVDYAYDNDASTIVIGNNKNWKQNSHMSKNVNQTFVQMPFTRLIEMITYKAEERGISVVIVEESYTSGTSFLDGELPVKENYNKSRRIHRGLFKSNAGELINADVNGSLQILKKVFSNAYANEIEAVALQPSVVNISSV